MKDLHECCSRRQVEWFQVVKWVALDESNAVEDCGDCVEGPKATACSRASLQEEFGWNL